MTRDGIRRLLPLAVIVVVAVAGLVLLRDRLTFEALSEHRETLLAYRDAHYGLAAVVFIAVYVAIVGFSLPGATVATLTGGFLFGVMPGVLFNILGASVGATIIFLAAKHGLGDRLSAHLSRGDGRIARLKHGIDRNQWSVLFMMRLAPVVPFFVANVLPALLNVRTVVFVVTTVLGIIPGALIYTSVGAGLGEVFSRNDMPDLGVIFEPYVILPIIGLIVLAAVPILVRAKRGEVSS